MARTMLILDHRRASDLQLPNGLNARGAGHRVLNLIHGVLGGNYSGSSGFQVTQAQSTATLTLAGASGTVGAVINGVSTTVTASGGDVATAAALAAAINASADPLVSQHVRASNLDSNNVATGVVTVTGYTPGPAGNAVTLAATGTGITASSARLSGGSVTTYSLSASP